MPSPITRLYKRLIHKKNPEHKHHHGQRKLTLPPPLPRGVQHQTAADQSQSAFFSRFPPEIRQLIYQATLNNNVGVVHISKKARKPLELVRCKDECAMQYNYKCWAGDATDNLDIKLKESFRSTDGFVPFLLTCQKAYVLDAAPCNRILHRTDRHNAATQKPSTSFTSTTSSTSDPSTH